MLKDEPRAVWTGVGMGVSRGYENFPPLPGVVRELQGVIQPTGNHGEGAVPGVLLLDETLLLMQTFYRRRQAEPAIGKGQALRRAQLALLRGEVKGQVDQPSRGVAYAGEVAEVPPFILAPQAPFAHPYYWAPFILIGNWR